MNDFVNAAVSNSTKSKKDALTANGAVTRSTSGKSHLDLFAIAGAARNAQGDVVSLFSKAYADDKGLALRIMFWARDIRGGAGERQAFRNVMRHLAVNDPVVVEKLIPFVSEYGRWDDMIESLPTESFLFKKAATEMLKAIESGDGLAAKWSPRKGPIALALREAWSMAPKQYRRFIVSHTKVVETLMCNKQWDAIEFDKLPSLAGLRYQKAFGRNASKRYEEYKAKLVKGEVKINVSTLFPHNVISNLRRGSGDEMVLNAQWKALPDYLGENSGKVLVMSDVSGSMDCGVGGGSTALDVSLALGMYTAERLKGPFKDLVLTFSQSPQLHKLRGNTVGERMNNLARVDWDMSTNLQAAFELVLNTGLKNKVPQEDMPETIVIISDMETDQAWSDGKSVTAFKAMKDMYKNAGYKVPGIIWWNVNGRAGNNPVKYDANNTCMISGYSPAILSTVLTGEPLDPMKALLDTVMTVRYDCVDSAI